LGGSHDFKLGVQFNSGLGEYTYGLNDYIYTYGAIPAYGYTQLPFTQGGRLKSVGVFADDAYQVGRATINLGLRYDDSKAYFVAQDFLDARGNPTGAQSKAVDELFRWRVVSPRLGINLGFAVSYVYKRSEQQTAFPDIGGTYQLVPYTAPAGAKVAQVYRLTSGADSRLFQLRNDDRMFANYHGVEFDIKKRMSNHWQANFGLTLSKSTGRGGSSSARATPATSQISLAGIFGQNPNDFINSDGRVIGDRPVVLKTQFLYQMPWGIMTSFNFQSQSGKPIYSEIRAATSATGIPGASRIIAVASDGQDRTKIWQTFDARVEKNFKLGKNPEVAVFGDFLNLFNSDANESVLDRRLGNSNYLLPSRFILPRRLMVGGKFRF